jgi:hypothetical protein
MSLDTYSNLQDEVASWLFGRDDLATKSPTFIRMFEAKANRILKCRQMEQRATADIDMNSDEPEFISLPQYFHSMRRVRLKSVTGTPNLKFAVPAQLDMLREKDNTEGTPTHFTIFGDEMELYPTPSQTEQLEMIFRKNLTALSDSNTTNWLLDLAPDLYLYGALLEAAPYLHEDERIPVWASAVGSGFEQLNKLSEEATYNAGPLVIRRRSGGYS